MKIFLTAFFLLICIGLYSQVTFNIDEESGDMGQLVELDVTVENFTEVDVFQFSINWNENILEFQEFTNLNQEIGLENSDLNHPDSIGVPGAITVAWTRVPPGTLDDNSVLFTMVFEIIGEECEVSPVEFSDDPTVIEVVAMGELAATEFNDGSVMVNGAGCGGGDINFNGSDEFGAQAETVCVEITADGFLNITSFSYTHSWDPQVIRFQSISNINVPGMTMGDFNTENSDLGFIEVDYSGSPATVPAGTPLYELCFQIIGFQAESTNITFTGSPSVQSTTGSLDPSFNPGSVTVTENYDGIILEFSTEQYEINGQVCVDAIGHNFTGVEGFEGTVSYNDQIISGSTPTNFMIPMMSASDFNCALTGSCVFAWSGDSPTNIDEGVLFTMCFDVEGECGDQSVVTFSDEVLAIEISDGFDPLDFIVIPGSIEVTEGCFSLNPSVNNVTCNGDCDGSIALNITGGTQPISIEWTGGIPDNEDNPTQLCAGNYNVTVTDGDGNELTESITVDEPPLLTATVDNVIPDDGTNSGAIELSVNGGTPPYSFVWSGPTAIPVDTEDPTGLEGGLYSVTISDVNNCEIILSDINTSDELVSFSVVPSCIGACTGRINLNVDALENPDFNWDSGDIPAGTEDPEDLCAGEYTVTVTHDEGTEVVVINVPETQVISIDMIEVQDDAGGNGSGSIDLTVSGGNPPYTFEWSDDDIGNEEDPQGLFSDIYMVTITDGRGCRFISENILVPEGFGIVNAEVVPVICRGEENGMIEITVAGGEEPYTYQWSCVPGINDNLIEDLAPGFCTVTVTDAEGLTATATYEIIEPEPFSIFVDVTRCSTGAPNGGAVVTANGGHGGFEYLWSSGEETMVAEQLRDGNASVTVTDAFGCTKVRVFNVCRDSVIIDCFTAKKVITPNGDGRNDIFRIQCAPNFENTLRIYNLAGQEVFTANNYNNTWNGVEQDGTPLDEGTYLYVLEIIRNDGSTDIFQGAVTILLRLH